MSYTKFQECHISEEVSIPKERMDRRFKLFLLNLTAIDKSFGRQESHGLIILTFKIKRVDAQDVKNFLGQ